MARQLNRPNHGTVNKRTCQVVIPSGGTKLHSRQLHTADGHRDALKEVNRVLAMNSEVSKQTLVAISITFHLSLTLRHPLAISLFSLQISRCLLSAELILSCRRVCSGSQ